MKIFKFFMLVFIVCFGMPISSVSAQSGSENLVGFTSPINLENLVDGRKVKLQESLTFIDNAGFNWTVPAGFVSDGASIPRAFWEVTGSPLSSDMTAAAIFHDYYTSGRQRSTDATNRMFYEAMVASDVPTVKAKTMYAAAAMFGPKWGDLTVDGLAMSGKLEVAVADALRDAELGAKYSTQTAEQDAWVSATSDIDFNRLQTGIISQVAEEFRTKSYPSIEDVEDLTGSLEVRVALNTILGTASPNIGIPQKSQEIFLDKNVDDKGYYDWMKFTTSNETVFVFVHGILSDKLSAWTSDTNGSAVFWPQLISDDPLFSRPNIFLAGYYTGIGSGSYRIEDASDYLNMQLRNVVQGANRSVIDHKNIVFVTHSMGGIVVRDYLVNEREFYSGKNVGLLLFASPSGGSKDANRLRWFIDYLGNEAAGELSTDSGFLINLDRRFRKLISGNKIQNLSGQEAIENHYVYNGFFGGREKTVNSESGGRYFHNTITIPDSDHFSIVKPDNITHPSHLLLQDFYNDKMLKLMALNN